MRSGSLVLVVYHAREDKVQSLDDLKRPEVKKIALANPAIAPYGKAGKQALEQRGPVGRAPVQDRHRRIGAAGTLYAQKGDVEAALVGRAIANVPEVRPVEVDTKLYDPIIQALGIVAATQHRSSRTVRRFVLDAEGQEILKEFGFASSEQEQSSERSLHAKRIRVNEGRSLRRRDPLAVPSRP